MVITGKPSYRSVRSRDKSQELKQLMERLSHLAPGARAAAERRGATLRLEETRRREAQAYRMAHYSRGLSRAGQAFV